MADFDVVVIGAGPAGLGAVTVLTQYPHLRVLVVDAGPGPDERNDANPQHTAVGAGGAALVNDGKFTFGLAGTKAKLLPGFQDAVLEVARLVGVSKDEVENHMPERSASQSSSAEVKKSLTVQRPRFDREQLIRDIIHKAKSVTFWWNSHVTDLQTKDDIVSMTVDGKIWTTESCIIATGRLASTTMTTNLPVAKEGRLEVGVRIAAANSDRLFNGWGWTDQVKDPKLIIWRTFKGAEIEIRSFCFCRDGEVVESHFDKLGKDVRLWSGVSDTAPTGMTNLGINVRVLDKTLATTLGHPDMRAAGVTHVDDLSNIFEQNDQSPPATEWEELLQFAVLEFEKEVLAIQKQTGAVTHGPYEIYTWAVEGFREYVCHDPETGFVRDTKAMIAVVGDCTGEYRGIVPAMAGGVAVTKVLVKRLVLQHSFRDLPRLRASNSTFGNTFMAEVHVFLGPLNPDPETIARYKSDVEKYNREKQPKKLMKAPVLSLFFRGGAGYVTVLQSARYVMVEDEQEALRELLTDEEYWQACGWQTLRRKLETTVHGKIQGLPNTVEEAIKFGDGGWYYESHIKVRSDSAVYNDPDSLRPLCKALTISFGWPVVLSYSSTEQFDPDTGKSLGVPRFLNLRMRCATVAEFLARVKVVCDAINCASQTWKVEKTIDEAVISDSWPAMDDGWINWNKKQLVLICGPRFAGKSTVCADVTAKMRDWGLLCKTMRLSDVVKAEYLKLHHLPPTTFNDRAEKEKHRPGLLKLLDAKTGTDPLFAARALVTTVNQWSGRGTIFVEDVRFPYDVEYIKTHAADTFDVCPVLLRPPQDVRVARGWVYNPQVDDHNSEHAFENVNPADFVCFDVDGATDVATKLFEHLKEAHHH